MWWYFCPQCGADPWEDELAAVGGCVALPLPAVKVDDVRGLPIPAERSEE
jgi:hypothetical protein